MINRILIALSITALMTVVACSTDDERDGGDLEQGTPPAVATSTPGVSGTAVESTSADWVYWLSDIDLGAIASAQPPIAVIDYSRDGGADSEFSRSDIDSLRSSMSGEKLVISYMSIGEAENYRYYWEDSWGSSQPPWLERENNSWPGNFKVRFWDPDWQRVIFGSPDSYLDKIIAAGFDGVYLDIVDAYDYFTERNRESAEDEMVEFITAISEYAKAQRPGFLIFPQNAPELGVRSDYLAVVDGIGMEGVYYGWDEPNVATNDTDTQWLEEQLARFVDAGKTVLAVDYVAKDADVAEAYRWSRAQGFNSTATHIDLDRLPIPAP